MTPKDDQLDQTAPGEDSGSGQLPRHSNISSIRPGAPVPLAVLITRTSDEGLYLEGYHHGHHGAQAYLTSQDAAPLWRELAAGFTGEKT